MIRVVNWLLNYIKKEPEEDAENGIGDEPGSMKI